MEFNIASRRLALAVLCTFACACSDSIESTFTLAPDSKLPAWFVVPLGMTRDQLTVSLDLYTKFHATARLMDGQGHVLSKASGRVNEDTRALEGRPEGFKFKYPLYEVITINGITQVIEHRRMEPIFYVNDDPAVLTRLIPRTAQD